MLIANVLSGVAAYYGLQMMDLTGPSRKLLLARQRGMNGVARGSKNGGLQQRFSVPVVVSHCVV